MKDELMRELFEKWARSQPTRLKGKSSWQDLEMRPNGNYKNCAHHYAWQGFRAAWNLFAPHIEILEDDYKPEVGDKLETATGALEVVGIGDKGQPYVNHGQGWEEVYWDRIIQRNNKACIKAKDLMGEA